jgi:hypothetical protein
MKRWIGFEHGIGIGGWLTNFKRFTVIPLKKMLDLTKGDFYHFDSFITEKDIKYISSLGADHIRLGFDQYVLEEVPGTFREHMLDIVENFVKWCNKHKLNVVLNLHKAIGTYAPDDSETISLMTNRQAQQDFIAFWVNMEKHFANYPNVAFELLNEVRNVEPKLWNDLAEETIAAIRKINKTRQIVVGSSCWNSASLLKDLKIFDDEYVIYTFHMYEPFIFTSQRGVLVENSCYYNGVFTYPSDVEPYRDFIRAVEHREGLLNYQKIDKQFLRDKLQPAFDFVNQHPDNILWCGEFGCIRHIDLNSRENWFNDVVSLLIENNIPYAIWNYLSTINDGNKYSLVDDDKRKILSKRLKNIIRGKIE